MSRVSRRQRAHEEQAGKRKLRNLFAFLFGLIAIGVAAFFIYSAFPPNEARIKVLIQKIQTSNYHDQNKKVKTRRHAIPFQDNSCAQLAEAFRQFTNADILDVGAIQGTGEKVGLKSEDADRIDDSSVSVLYISGHIMLSGEKVVWIYPDQDKRKIEIYEVKTALEDFALTPGQKKIVLLDAGQYSWSPNHPNRDQNPFQEQLADIVEGIAAETNLWVILSHGPNEISLTCSPEKMSLFSVAVRETLRSVGKAASVNQLFNDIYQRCAHYSKNFGDESLQNPMLFRAGTGLVTKLMEDNGGKKVVFKRPIQISDDQESERKRQPRNLKNSFVAEDNFELGNFQSWLDSNSAVLHEQPVASTFNIENHLEPGQSLAALDDREYELASFPPAVRQKQQLVSDYRRNCVDLLMQLRVANWLRLWGSDQRRIIYRLLERAADTRDWDPMIAYDDSELNTAAVTGSNAVQQWNENHEDLIRVLHAGWMFNPDFELPGDVFDENQKVVLTPFQAELLGVITQRLLPHSNTPLVEVTTTQSDDETAPDSPAFVRSDRFKLKNESYQLSFDLPSEEANIPEYAPDKRNMTPWEESFQQTNSILRPKDKSDLVSSNEDAHRRIVLAMFGSEDLIEMPPATINVDIGKPSIEFDFSNLIELHPGHNFFKGKIKNSDRYYQIRVGHSGENISGIEYFLFKPDRLFADDSEEKLLETDGDFVFYVFATPNAGQYPDSVNFSFSAQALGHDAEELTKSVKLRFNTEPLISAKSVRDLGIESKTSEEVAMQPWKTSSVDDFSLPNYQPLQLNTLANLKSRFEFQFNNNSRIELKGLTFRLFLLSKETFGTVRADSIPRRNLDFVMGSDTWMDENFFYDKSKARLLASQSDVNISPDKKTFTIDFSFEQPKKDNENGSESPQPKIPEYIPIDAPLLMTISAREIGDIPLWFQFVEIVATPPFEKDDWKGISPFQIGNLLSRLNDFENFQLFSEHLPDTESLAEYFDGSLDNCQLHLITQSDSLDSQPLELQAAFSNQQFGVPKLGGQRAFAMIDAMGIPNLITMLIKSDQSAEINSAIRNSFAGFRVDSDFWESHQQGFLYNLELFDLTNHRNGNLQLEPRRIYLRKKDDASDAPVGDIKLKFSLPYGVENSPISSQENFCYSWRGSRSADNRLINPTNRSHLIATKDFAFISAVKRHEHVAKNIGATSVDMPLEIYQGTDDSGRLIGTWYVTTSNPNSKDSIAISPRTINQLSTNVTLDFSQIQPTCSNIRVGIEAPEGVLIDEHPDVFKSIAPAVYQAKVIDIARALEIDLNAMIKKKTDEGGGIVTTKLFVEAEDFFRQKWSKTKNVNLTAPKPPRAAAKSKKSAGK